MVTGTKPKSITRSVYDRILGEYADKGFRLESDGDHLLYLYHEDADEKPIAVFSQTGVRFEPNGQNTIQNVCCQYLNDRLAGTGAK
ncbi:MAG: hypothetical protein PHU08_00025 [Dehalococcoidales bacterium]|nr:hypothetical protein [Dehalococcoidales bacterium]